MFLEFGFLGKLQVPLVEEILNFWGDLHGV